MSTAGGPLILVVEDFDDAQDMYVDYLQHCGFRTAAARTGREAVEKATQLRPDLILMDLALPELDGWEATRLIKGDARTGTIPILACTGHAMPSHMQAAQEAGCDAFVIKPCLPEDLVAEIRRLLAA